VNPAIQQRVLEALEAVNDRGTTLVVIEHDMGVIEDIADRITVLNAGRVLTRGAFSEVVTDKAVREAYIGRRRDTTTETEQPLDAVNSTAVANGGDPPGTTRDGDTASEARAMAAANADSPRRSGPDGTVPLTSAETDSEGAESTGGTVDHDLDSLAAALESSDAGDGHGLVARDVVAGYGSHVVLDGVSVESRDGVTCVFGPNGSGKSTLLKAIGGVVPVRSGTVEYGDRTITNAEPHEIVRTGITTVPQTDRVFRGLSVRENLLLGATPVDDESIVEDRMDTVLDVFPALESSLSAPANSLSGGQQVMLGVARGMMTGADVYLLDEPFSGLAPSKIDEVFEVVRTLVETEAQVILVEQHVREALSIADHVYVLAQGEIQFDGPPADLRDADEVVDLYLGID
ncbi:MAG: branched-chain amino acid transport system ATP-binding protein, partial [Natronomonas sp.]